MSAVEEALVTAYAALRRRGWAEALAALEGHAPPAGRPAVGARLLAFRAQALDGLERLEEAERAAAEAVRLARRAGDDDGVQAVRALHARVLASLAARRHADAERARDLPLADTSDDVLLADAPDDDTRAARLVRKANVLADAGRAAEAAETARRALALSGASPREQVMARLLLARVEDAAPHLHAAHALADTADDPNLITAVAHAARAAAVPLRPPDAP